MAKDDDPWEKLDAQQKDGLSPEMARKLLAMNPAMRDRGMNTQNLVADSQKKGAKPAAVASTSDKGLHSELEAIRRHLDDEEKRITEAQKQLERDRILAKEKSFASLVKWLLAKDPDITSPLNQQALKDEATLLGRIGFDMKRYAEARKKQ